MSTSVGKQSLDPSPLAFYLCPQVAHHGDLSDAFQRLQQRREAIEVLPVQSGTAQVLIMQEETCACVHDGLVMAESVSAGGWNGFQNLHEFLAI
jgi:hypothetical protein